jgi:hypothetical protein
MTEVGLHGIHDELLTANSAAVRSVLVDLVEQVR